MISCIIRTGRRVIKYGKRCGMINTDCVKVENHGCWQFRDQVWYQVEQQVWHKVSNGVRDRVWIKVFR
jgi:hypothetical protein